MADACEMKIDEILVVCYGGYSESTDKFSR